MTRPSPPAPTDLRAPASATTPPHAGAPALRRVIIEHVEPEVDLGVHAAKTCVGDTVEVEADVFADGHEAVAAVVHVRPAGATAWTELPMEPLGNDRWRGEFVAPTPGVHVFTVEGWVDPWQSWRAGLRTKHEAGQDLAVDLRIGAALLRAIAAGEPPHVAPGAELEGRLEALASELEAPDLSASEKVARATADALAAELRPHAGRAWSTRHPRELPVRAERPLARFSTWYELFPRSCSPEPGRHGTLADCEAWLPRIARLGFDVLYLPPIHPIGRTHRKGPNNAATPSPEDPGSPWAIGAAEGGHTAVHPELGTLADVGRLAERARGHGIELALDLAYQCSPDHPWVREHPDWFRRRPDGTIQYAENPPKKYQDIYPLDFACQDWRALWEELRGVPLFWIEQGVRIFRVDNPHTKPFGFWEWMLPSIQERHPDTIFLSEAFTRPRIMERLAKLGFSQSYTYFTWRNTKQELTEYFTELTRAPLRDVLRPNLWPNTPDILHEVLQTGGPPAFRMRLVLAATLGASYGIYGPPYELMIGQAVRPGSEEYLDSEKYQLRHWDLDRPDALGPFIARMNRIRRQSPALQSDRTLRFHPTDEEMLLAYSKHVRGPDGVSGRILVVVNLDPHRTRAGWVDVQLEALEIDPAEPYEVHDLLADGRWTWRGWRNFVQLDPHVCPAHVFRIRTHRSSGETAP